MAHRPLSPMPPDPRASLPPPGSAPAAPSRLAHPIIRRITLACGGVLGSGLLLLLAAWLAAPHLIRLGLQLSALALAGLLCLVAVVRTLIPWPRRLIVLLGSTLLFLAVLDSVDGFQDWLPTVVILLCIWALEYAYTTLYLLDPHRSRTVQRWLAIGLGSSASCVYVGMACYYGYLHRAIAPVNIDRHPLFGAGILLAILIKWMGEIRPYQRALTGQVRVCPTCGLRNIPERTQCKHCRALLVAPTYVSDNDLPF